MMDFENLKNSTVLIVDDNPTNLGVLYNYLSDFGLKVFMVESGEEALKAVQAHIPDIILLDIMLPGMDGYETCQKLKNNENTKDIPILFISALSDTIKKLKGFVSGGVDYITKPFQREEVLARINTHLTIVHQQKEINRQNEEYKELLATKNKFFKIIGHDLKNPLSIIMGTTQHLLMSLDTISKEKLKKSLKRIDTASNNLYNLLENLLEWAMSQSDSTLCEFTENSLNSIIDETIYVLKENAHTKNIALSSEIKENIKVYGDTKMINTVFRNIVSNAIKFTNPGGNIWIRSEDHKNTLQISIADNGIGIEESKIKKLFRIGEKNISNPGTENESGTGLGLIICSEFIKKHGGRIWVESKKDIGTTFYFTLPKGCDKQLLHPGE